MIFNNYKPVGNNNRKVCKNNVEIPFKKGCGFISLLCIEKTFPFYKWFYPIALKKRFKFTYFKNKIALKNISNSYYKWSDPIAAGA